MKLSEVKNEQFAKELKDAFANIKVRKTGGHPTMPHENKKKKMKKEGQRKRKHKGKHIDYYA